MRVLGIDCGTEYTGYGVVELCHDGRLTCLACGAVKLSPREPMPARLSIIFDHLGAIIVEHRPDRVAIEDVFYALNVKSALKLGQVRGVAMLAASSAGLEVAEYSPLSIKSAVVGYGRAEKQQVQHMVTRLLNLAEIPEPPDAADALAIRSATLQPHWNASGHEEITAASTFWHNFSTCFRLPVSTRMGSDSATAASPVKSCHRQVRFIFSHSMHEFAVSGGCAGSSNQPPHRYFYLRLSRLWPDHCVVSVSDDGNAKYDSTADSTTLLRRTLPADFAVSQDTYSRFDLTKRAGIFQSDLDSRRIWLRLASKR
jgi:crossover junction endodeoxyribonuclease RuvC